MGIKIVILWVREYRKTTSLITKKLITKYNGKLHKHIYQWEYEMHWHDKCDLIKQ